MNAPKLLLRICPKTPVIQTAGEIERPRFPRSYFKCIVIQFNATTTVTKFLVSKENMVLRRWESETWKFGFIKRVHKGRIDRMHKWRPTKYSFVFVLIRPTSLVLKEHFFCILSVLTRLVSLISTKTKEYFFGPPFMHSVSTLPNQRILYRRWHCLYG